MNWKAGCEENRLSGLGGGRRPKAVLYPHQLPRVVVLEKSEMRTCLEASTPPAETDHGRNYHQFLERAIGRTIIRASPAAAFRPRPMCRADPGNHEEKYVGRQKQIAPAPVGRGANSRCPGARLRFTDCILAIALSQMPASLRMFSSSKCYDNHDLH